MSPTKSPPHSTRSPENNSIADIALPAQTSRFAILTPFVALIGAMAFGQPVDWQGTADYRDPARFETAVSNFEKHDLESSPPEGAILFIGSSTIRRWDSLATDMAPLTTIKRGIGGSNFNDLLHYADRLVIPYQPRAIVVYSGGNDIQQNITPSKAVDTLKALVDKVLTALPDCRIYILSIKVSVKNWALRPIENQANDMMMALCEQDDRLQYIDVASGMLDEHGEPNLGIFIEDRVHMNPAGYRIWKDILKPVLVKRELKYEPAAIDTGSRTNP